MLRSGFTVMILPLALAIFAARGGEDNLQFRGALVAEPCVIPPGEENIALDFGTVISKYLYANQRTKSEPFILHLTECDPAIAGSVSVTFSGVESAALPGLLAPDAGSAAKGIAIGIETASGSAQPLNKPSPSAALLAGDNRLSWQAFVQGEPAALADKSLTPGAFTATATFSLDYE